MRSPRTASSTRIRTLGFLTGFGAGVEQAKRVAARATSVAASRALTRERQARSRRAVAGESKRRRMVIGSVSDGSGSVAAQLLLDWSANARRLAAVAGAGSTFRGIDRCVRKIVSCADAVSAGRIA